PDHRRPTHPPPRPPTRRRRGPLRPPHDPSTSPRQPDPGAALASVPGFPHVETQSRGGRLPAPACKAACIGTLGIPEQSVVVRSGVPLARRGTLRHPGFPRRNNLTLPRVALPARSPTGPAAPPV